MFIALGSIIVIGLIAVVVEIILTTNASIRNEENVRNDYSFMLNAISNRNRLESALNDIVRNYLCHENNTYKCITNVKMVIAMNPVLRSNEVVLKLLHQIEQSENTILISKADYNSSVSQYNKYIRCFPANIFSVASKYRFERVGNKRTNID